MYTSLSGIFQKLELEAYLLHRAGHIPQKPPKKNSEFFQHYFLVAVRFCIYKGISEKYKGKYAVTPFLLSLLVGRSNHLNSFVRLLHLYCCFQKHPYCPSPITYSHMAIWPYDHISAIWPYSHMGIWPKMASIWVSPETAIKMQHSGEGIKLIRPSYQK